LGFSGKPRVTLFKANDLTALNRDRCAPEKELDVPVLNAAMANRALDICRKPFDYAGKAKDVATSQGRDLVIAG
jgi:hypothetical protein